MKTTAKTGSKTALLRRIAASVALAFGSWQAAAGPVSVTVSSFEFQPGSGYGQDANEGSGTLLGVVFGTTFTGSTFTLTAPGDAYTFEVGTVQFNEPNNSGGISSQETDHLDVAALLTFTSPFGQTVTVSATGTAYTGPIADSHADLLIDWAPMLVAFGTNGQLQVSLADLEFTGRQTLTQMATISLVSADTDVRVSQVPEPGTLLLAGAALAGLGVVRRRCPRG